MRTPAPFSRPGPSGLPVSAAPTLPMAATMLALVATLLGPAPALAASLCERGLRQSPIDITGARRSALPPLQFEYHPSAARLANDGHTVRVHLPTGVLASRLLIAGVPHPLSQFHFHRTGGDRIAGEEFPLGLHFLHKSPAGQLVSLVVLLRQGQENAALARLLPLMPAVGGAPLKVAQLPIDPTALIPSQRGYFQYEGSLTGPPCTEGVRWIVMKQPLELSAAQLDELARRFPPNARPVQPLNGRVVLEGG